jgi:hypothetical protein
MLQVSLGNFMKDAEVRMELRMSNESSADRSAVQEPEPGQTGDDYLLPDTIYLWIYGNPKHRSRSVNADTAYRELIPHSVEAHL